ncbi:hypothetical protein BJX68DRAFT_268050 [Aspergillus pseudodeflectus]|uniref:Zn(2)-C6 fungal-type domain-containing protein n=1 Tax=Aspergillus pseudodeflectus TaxID=176178 RepID=A0ABR4K5R4_9EURO
MTTTMAAQTVQTTSLEPSMTANYKLTQETALSDPCPTSWFSKWLWPSRAGRPGPPVETSATGVPRQLLSSDVGIRSDASYQHEHDRHENPFPCRACQAWGVQCDRQTPRCAHCLDQQILCFYVEPLRVTMKRARKSKDLPAAPPRDLVAP